MLANNMFANNMLANNMFANNMLANNMNVLFMGRVGSGKSTLTLTLISLFRNCKHSTAIPNNPFGHTEITTEKLQFFDTPGFSDSKDEEKEFTLHHLLSRVIDSLITSLSGFVLASSECTILSMIVKGFRCIDGGYDNWNTSKTTGQYAKRKLNVLLFGEKGGGKSSVIDMIHGMSKMKSYLNVIELETDQSRPDLDGVHCDVEIMAMRMGAISAKSLELYQQLEKAKERQLPIILFVTHCEFEDGNKWFAANKDAFEKLGMTFSTVICGTTLNRGPHAELFRHKFDATARKLHDTLAQVCFADRPTKDVKAKPSTRTSPYKFSARRSKCRDA